MQHTPEAQTVHSPVATVLVSERIAGSRLGADRRLWLVAAALCALTLLVFLQTIHFDFINFDDDNYVYSHSIIAKGLTLEGVKYAFTSYKYYYWHPVTWLSHMLDCQLFGLNAGWHHLTNVLIHVANVLLVFFVLVRFTGAFWRSALVAALCAIHPLRVESVAWVAERKDLLGCLFWLLTMWMYLEYVKGPERGRKYLLALFMFALAVMSKPTVVTLPCALLLLDYWPLQRLSFGSIGVLLKEKIPFFLLSVFSAVITYEGQKEMGAVGSGLDPGTHVANVFVSYALYVRDLVWPGSLAVLYPYPLSIPGSTLLVSILVLAVITAGVLFRARQSPYLLVGWFWFLGVLVPMSGILQVGSTARADRFTYIPAIGFFILIVWAAAEAATRYGIPRSGLVCISVLLVTILAAKAWAQTSYWSDGESLYKHAIAITGRNPMLKKFLGLTLDRKHRLREAELYIRSAIAEQPDYADAYISLGVNLIEQRRWQEALNVLSAGVRISPNAALMVYNRSIALEATLPGGRSDARISTRAPARPGLPIYGAGTRTFGAVVFAERPESTGLDGVRYRVGCATRLIVGTRRSGTGLGRSRQTPGSGG